MVGVRGFELPITRLPDVASRF